MSCGVLWRDITPQQLAHELHDETLCLTMARTLDAKRTMRAAGMAALLASLLSAIARPGEETLRMLQDSIATMERAHPR